VIDDLLCPTCHEPLRFHMPAKAAAARLCVNRRTIIRWVGRGLLEGVQIGLRYRVCPGSLARRVRLQGNPQEVA
jgi:hypothetical protein